MRKKITHVKGLPVSTPEDYRQYNLLRRLAFPEECRKHTKKWELNNKEKVRAKNERFRTQNPEAYRKSKNKSYRNRLKRDPAFRIKCNLRRRIAHAMARQKSTPSVLTALGCSIEDFKIYLESRFEPGMSWLNYGVNKGDWNIDHIMPCAIFDLTNPLHVRRCFHFSNCQPMWWSENLNKRATVETEQFRLL